MKSVAVWLGAMALATAGLLGLDLLLHHLLGDHAPNLWFGLVIAVVAFALMFKSVTVALCHPDGLGSALLDWRWWIVAVITSIGFIVGLPAGLTLLGHSDGPPIRSQAPIPGRVDLVVVSPGPRHEGALNRPPLPPADLAAWDLRYTIAVPARERPGLAVLVAGTDSRAMALRALRTGRALEPGKVEWRPGAQRAVVLDVDQAPFFVRGSGPEGPALGQIGGLARAADRLVAATSSLQAPLFVLLADSRGDRLDRWAAWARDHQGEADVAADLEGPTLLDAGLRLVSQSRTTLADRQLAYAYRPLLFFDKRELYDWPVDVDAAFAEEAVRMCKHGAGGDQCETVKRASDLDQSFDYLKVDREHFGAADLALSPQAVGSTYYYHVVHAQAGSKTYIDYWWYLPYNPSLSAWMCSPGFNVPNLDCFDHESDWEGVTVEVSAEGEPPSAVLYAQHANVARLPWDELKEGWRGLDQAPQVDVGNAHHPLVFVARASHASYRNPCADPACFQYGSVVPEGKHGGRSAWTGNDDDVCAGKCLKPLPITRDDKPATWNAFSGPWGTQTCILGGTFCDHGEAPHSPFFQWRYTHLGMAH
jgi:hypothetical protein